MTIKRYLSDPALTGLSTVTQILPGEQPIVRLKETWFHPQGGGQKADRGFIGLAAVLHVAHNAGEVDHYVDRVDDLVVGGQYTTNIDSDWRELNAAYHSAGHLIASVVEARYPNLKAVSGHQWPGEGRVEFEGDIGDLDSIKPAIEHDIEEVISTATPVVVVGDPFVNRSVKIGNYHEIPCGGTHVTSVDKIGRLLIDGIKRKSGRLRISYTVWPQKQS